MIRALRTASLGMFAQSLKLDNIANNLANTNTTGFKRSSIVKQLAVLVPLPAQLLAAANVGDGVDEAAIEQAQPERTESRVHAGSVRSVAV